MDLIENSTRNPPAAHDHLRHWGEVRHGHWSKHISEFSFQRYLHQEPEERNAFPRRLLIELSTYILLVSYCHASTVQKKVGRIVALAVLNDVVKQRKLFLKTIYLLSEYNNVIVVGPMYSCHF